MRYEKRLVFVEEEVDRDIYSIAVYQVQLSIDTWAGNSS